MPLPLYDLTFLYISFAKIFCQNYVKKNRKHGKCTDCKSEHN